MVPIGILGRPASTLGVISAKLRQPQAAGGLPLVPRVPDYGDIRPRHHRASPPRVEGVAREQRAGRVGDLPHRAEMIRRKEAGDASDLFAQPERPPRDGHAVRRALLADGRFAPEHARV